MPDVAVALAAANLHSLCERLTGAVERARRRPEDPEAVLDLVRISARVEEIAQEIGAEAARVRQEIAGC